jgi:hypothetical protein
MADFAPLSDTRTPLQPARISLRANNLPFCIQYSFLSADEPVEQRLKVPRNLNEANNVNLTNAQRIGRISSDCLS